ncbi:MAG: DUF1499 domain-containing protein [Nitrospiraceae bacterium]|nr:DUF1499 domain-containing protein [Nitrospiraceae bacterium]
MLYIILGLVLVVVLALIVLSVMSRRAPGIGLIEGRLRPAPGTPNCVCSEEAAGSPAFVVPLSFEGAPEAVWEDLKRAVGDIGGRLEGEGHDYVWATFRTPIFRFVDDLELRMDREEGLIHVRSASRVGKADFGCNRKRVEKLRARFEQEQTAHQSG